MSVTRSSFVGFLLLGVLLIVLHLIILNTQHKQDIKQYAASQPCTQNITFVNGNYLIRNGINFTYMGQRVCLYGATIYTSQGGTAPNYDWMSPQFTQRIDWDLNLAQQAHLNVIRSVSQSNSATDDPYNPVIWQNMDYLVQQARAKGMFVLLDLSTFRNHLRSQNINPYDPAVLPQWQQYINFVVNRYKNAPNVSNYSITGEVLPTNSTTFPNSTTQGYIDFFTATTGYVYQADGGNHLIAAGGLTFLTKTSYGIPWQQIFSLPHVDIAAIHVYDSNRLDPINTSDDLHITVPMVSMWAQQNNKPTQIEEYGLVQQIGDQVRATDMGIIEQAAIQYGYQTLIYWNLGPQVTNAMDYDVNPQTPLAWQQLVNGAAAFYGSTIIPSALPTNSVSNTSTPTNPAGSTVFHLTICPHGLGNCGDNVNANSGGNPNPLHTTRSIALTILNASGQPIATGQGTVLYTSSSQNFQGDITIRNMPNGQYLASVKMDNFLPKQILGIITVSSGQSISLPAISLVSGNINNDNQLDILDYNILISCFGSKQSTSSCLQPPNAQSPGADINDDGHVEGVDYNLFLRELSVQRGG